MLPLNPYVDSARDTKVTYQVALYQHPYLRPHAESVIDLLREVGAELRTWLPFTVELFAPDMTSVN